jgi:hypothetical protein
MLSGWLPALAATWRQLAIQWSFRTEPGEEGRRDGQQWRQKAGFPVSWPDLKSELAPSGEELAEYNKKLAALIKSCSRRGTTYPTPLAEGCPRPHVWETPMDSAMTPDRIRECLAAMHWSQRRLAEILYCDDRMVRRWADGSEPIPESVERWLEELVSAHKALPLPIAPKR